ncbi:MULTISPECIES: hypothetical protein [unclassified Bradyrhizobium]|uniref:hypothetical protein n=1 Tax=unclassified Bradyrhizobium TaxID=2631580 RepID=UPI0028EE080D|nr:MULTISPECIES: hypothetical protein [unclassified Bradyrhizobium]
MTTYGLAAAADALHLGVEQFVEFIGSGFDIGIVGALAADCEGRRSRTMEASAKSASAKVMTKTVAAASGSRKNGRADQKGGDSGCRCYALHHL